MEQKTNNNLELLTTQEAAEYLKMHEMTIYRYCKTGKIPCSKIGGRWRISKKILNEMITMGDKSIG